MKTRKEKGSAGVIKNSKKRSDGNNRLPIQCMANRFNDSDADLAVVEHLATLQLHNQGH